MSRSDDLKKRLDAKGARWMEWRGVEVAADFGDPEREYRAVRTSGLGIADRSWRDTLVVTGVDGVSWLQGLVTSDLRELVREGSGQLTTAVNLVGRLIAEARVLHMPDILLLDLETGILAGEFLPHLRRHVITEDVTLLDRSEQTARLGVFGRRSAAFLQQLFSQKNGELVRPVGALELFEGAWGSLAGRDVVIQRIPMTGGPGYDISCASEDAAELWDILMSAGELTPVGFETLETLRIEAGVPRFGKELTEKRIPLEAGLDEAISFNKGCYLGQEIIARLDTRGTPARLLRTLVFEGGAAPEVGAAVEVFSEKGDSKNVGEVVSSVWSPQLNAPIALAYIKREHNEIGNEVQVEGRPARVEALGYSLASPSANI
jgi:folate-binding protein YgfZ